MIFFDYQTKSLVPALAVSWSWDAATTTKLTLILRENVFFHDGTPFNATAVKWNFDRLNYFGNASGTLPAGELQAYPASIYQFNATTPIMKTIIVNSEYNVTIELTKTFTPVEGLLAYTGSNMISPAAHSNTAYINLTTDLVIGTGPFIYDGYIPNDKVRFHAYHNYWRGKAEIEEMIYLYFNDEVTMNNAMLNGDIDYLGMGNASYKPAFVNDPNIHVEEVGTSTLYRYIQFNPITVNITWRKAIQHAFNYTYYLNEIKEGKAIRSRNLVPLGFPGRNDSVIAADFNITKAREFLQDEASLGVGWDVGAHIGDIFTPGSDEALWLNAKFITFGFRTDPSDNFTQLLLTQFANNMALIGLNMTEQSYTWPEYITNARVDPSFMYIFYTGWDPEYFETFEIINPLVNPKMTANFAQVDIPEINTYLALANAEPDERTRYGYYEHLQYLIHDKYFIQMPLDYDLLHVVHTEALKDFPYNINNDLHFYPCKWNKTITLSSDAGNPDTDGIFDLNWTNSTRTANYSVYSHSSYISEINTSVNLLASEIIDLSYSISGLPSGEYYYRIVAHNSFSNISSNCIYISVQKPPSSFILSSNAENLDYDGTFNLSWTTSDYAENYSVYLYGSFITQINSSVSLLQDGITNNSYAVIGLNNGDHFFKIMAYNQYGNGESNCIQVIVQSNIPPIPFGNYYLLLTLISIISIIYITKKKIKKV